MDIEVHGSVKEIGVSRPEEFGRKIINLKDCNIIKVYPRESNKIDDFIEIEIHTKLRKSKHKFDRVITSYKLRFGRAIKIRPEVSNSMIIETIGFDE